MYSIKAGRLAGAIGNPLSNLSAWAKDSVSLVARCSSSSVNAYHWHRAWKVAQNEEIR